MGARRAWTRAAALIAASAAVTAGCGGESVVTETVAGPTVTIEGPAPEPAVVETAVVTETVTATVTATETVTESEPQATPASDGGDTPVTADDAEAQAAPSSARIGQRVRDNGAFSFVVRRVSRANQLKDHFGDIARPAPGATFVVVNVRSRNDGNAPAMPFCGDASVRLEDQRGRLFNVDGDTTIVTRASGTDDAYCSDVQPGFTVLTRLVFQVPKGTRPVAVHISDQTEADDYFGETAARVELR